MPVETFVPTAVNSAQVLPGVAHWERKQHTNSRSEDGFLKMQAKRGDSEIQQHLLNDLGVWLA